ESVIFLETTNAALAVKTAAFLNLWFGANPPSNLRLGNYTGVGVGLGTEGDAVNLYNSAGVLQASVAFGASTPAPGPFRTFDNASGINNGAISSLSANGINGA